MMLPDHYPQFFTATILEWKHLLKPGKYKELIASSLHFLIQDKRVVVYGFVFMSNHIHLVWQIQPGHKREDVQRDFLKYTAQKMKQDLENNHPQVLVNFLVNAKDRKYQVWERNPLSVDLWSREGDLSGKFFLFQFFVKVTPKKSLLFILQSKSISAQS